MLEQLDSIDWKSYDAEYMPALIRGLASPELQTHLDSDHELILILAPTPVGIVEEPDDAAIQKLLETGLPIIVIPFLIELLQSEDVKWKASILAHLSFMSRYPKFELETEASIKRAALVFEVLKASIKIFQRFLGDTDPRVKACAQELTKRLRVE